MYIVCIHIIEVLLSEGTNFEGKFILEIFYMPQCSLYVKIAVIKSKCNDDNVKFA